jgi:transposase InsO family protein
VSNLGFRGYPAAVRTDNGSEFTSRAFIAWSQGHGIRHILIEPGRPMQNGYIESSVRVKVVVAPVMQLQPFHLGLAGMPC